MIDLGNLNKKTLKDILQSKRAVNIVEGFKKNIAIEELCQKCTFKDRFKSR
ncbi:MAG: SPASM domain-containing protein [Campylobacterota bacterium]|nr:SPASM domain-containing protein [Campylobacterota bacterium]